MVEEGEGKKGIGFRGVLGCVLVLGEVNLAFLAGFSSTRRVILYEPLGISFFARFLRSAC
jgi:hypothetical protein